MPGRFSANIAARGSRTPWCAAPHVRDSVVTTIASLLPCQLTWRARVQRVNQDAVNDPFHADAVKFTNHERALSLPELNLAHSRRMRARGNGFKPAILFLLVLEHVLRRAARVCKVVIGGMPACAQWPDDITRFRRTEQGGIRRVHIDRQHMLERACVSQHESDQRLLPMRRRLSLWRAPTGR